MTLYAMNLKTDMWERINMDVYLTKDDADMNYVSMTSPVINSNTISVGRIPSLHTTTLSIPTPTDNDITITFPTTTGTLLTKEVADETYETKDAANTAYETLQSVITNDVDNVIVVANGKVDKDTPALNSNTLTINTTENGSNEIYTYTFPSVSGGTLITTGNIDDADLLTKTDASDMYLAKADADTSDFLSKTEAATTYLTIQDAAESYINWTTADDRYLTKTDASNTYLTTINAGNTYLMKDDASNTYLTKDDASNTYATASDVAKLANVAKLNYMNTMGVANDITSSMSSYLTYNEYNLTIDSSIPIVDTEDNNVIYVEHGNGISALFVSIVFKFTTSQPAGTDFIFSTDITNTSRIDMNYYGNYYCDSDGLHYIAPSIILANHTYNFCYAITFDTSMGFTLNVSPTTHNISGVRKMFEMKTEWSNVDGNLTTFDITEYNFDERLYYIDCEVPANRTVRLSDGETNNVGDLVADIYIPSSRPWSYRNYSSLYIEFYFSDYELSITNRNTSSAQTLNGYCLLPFASFKLSLNV